MAQGLGARLSEAPQDQQGQVQPPGTEGIALEGKAHVVLCLQILTQCNFQVLAQETPCRFLSSCSAHERETLEV